jgi:hypothetical protein
MVRKTLLTAGILVGVAFGGAAFADADQKHGGQTGARQGGGASDTDGDGIVSPEELRTGLQAKLGEFDADGDGSLSISEFETLHSAMIRETMVDRFQYLDADGDGIVTAGEMTAPADVMTRMQSMRGGVDQDTSNDSMMNDN